MATYAPVAVFIAEFNQLPICHTSPSLHSAERPTHRRSYMAKCAYLETLPLDDED